MLRALVGLVSFNPTNLYKNKVLLLHLFKNKETEVQTGTLPQVTWISKDRARRKHDLLT